MGWIGVIQIFYAFLAVTCIEVTKYIINLMDEPQRQSDTENLHKFFLLSLLCVSVTLWQKPTTAGTPSRQLLSCGAVTDFKRKENNVSNAPIRIGMIGLGTVGS